VSLLWEAGFSMAAAGPVQSVVGRLRPGDLLVAAHNGGFPLGADEMRWQIDFLSQATR